MRSTLSGQGDRPFLLVLAEAGIGKSRLVRAAAFDASSDGVRVLVGSCLPISGMPLLPISDALRCVYEADNGQWLKAALADCPRFVGEAVAPLVPELEVDGSLDSAAAFAGDPWWRQRLFASLRALLAALGRTRATAIAIEDIHWADTSTLDLLDYLIAPGHEIAVPVVLTFRTEDDETAEQAIAWLARARRSPSVEILTLSALSRVEAAEQIKLLTGEAPQPAILDAIYRRSDGNALFTEQLVGTGHPSQPPPRALPADLAELFNTKLRRLGPESRLAARALATAGRPLDSEQLLDIARLSTDSLAHAIRELKSQRMLRAADTGDTFALRHALLGEAVMADMLAVERVDLHRRCAIAFATRYGQGMAAEIAEHWRLAGAVDEELRWTVRAARDAEALYASEQSAYRWLRALELWDRSPAPHAATGMDLLEVYAATEDALEDSGQTERACELAEAAAGRLADTASPAGKADLYIRLGAYIGVVAPERGLDLLEKAIETYEQLPPTLGLLRALDMRAALLRGQGRHDGAAQHITRALVAAEGLEVPAMRKRLLAFRAWADMEAGDPDAAIGRMDQARQLNLRPSDPRVEVMVAAIHTDILLKLCAPTVDVERAAAPGFQAITNFGLDEAFGTSILRSNLVEALIESGDVGRAAVLLDPLSHIAINRDLWALATALAELDMLHGNLSSAHRRFTDLAELNVTSISFRAEIGVRHAELELWARDAHSAYRRTVELLQLAAPTRESKFMGAVLVMAARAAADIAELGMGAGKGADADLAGDALNGLRGALAEDPLTPRRVPANAAAHRAAWEAECTRLCGESSAAAWDRAASEWDRLDRPHRAAYSRWRQAEALLTKRATRAQAKIALQRATQQAQQHTPLTSAIKELAQRARIDLEYQIAATVDSAVTSTTPFQLTEREVAVLRLIGEGLSNSEIGAALFISPRTASVHVTNILRKLEVSTRAHAATVAARHGLLH